MDDAKINLDLAIFRLMNEVRELTKKEEAEKWTQVLESQKQTIDGEEWVNQAEAKRIIKRTADNTLTDWVKKGAIQRRKIGGFWFYKKSELLKLYK